MTTYLQPGENAVTSSAEGITLARYSIFSTEVVLAVSGQSPRTPFADIAARLRDYERRFSRFAENNELAALNHGAGSWVPISAEMRRILLQALAVAVHSRGLVNIAVTPALLRAGYTRGWPAQWTPNDGAAPRPVPALTEILDVRDDSARLQPGHCVDFGGIAKGMWADEVVDLLGQNAAASLGGDVSIRGAGPDGEGWPVGLPSGRTVVVRDGGVATSGVTRRRSGSSHHVIDPRTGRPAQPAYQEVSVIGTSATTAEWVATAVLIGGAEADQLLQRADVVECFTSAATAEDGG
jgi:FAD:protein FMN transferase